MPNPHSDLIRADRVNHLRVDSNHAGRRIDNLLISLLSNVPKSHIYKLLRCGAVRINGRRVRPEARVAMDDVVRVPPIRRDQDGTVARGRQRGDYLLTQILHEDDALLVINKPAGMAVHGGTGLHYGLIETLRHARGEEFLELAHRLDRDTSGCLILAKSMRALRWLHAGLRAGTIGKNYLLLAHGIWKGGTRSIRSPLTRKTRSRGEAVVRVDPHGKTAITQFSLRQQFHRGCLLAADLGTGRTHQIRVHAAHLGHPIAGDDKYGDADFNRLMRQMGLRRMFLHAARVEIPMGTAVPLVVEALLPSDLQTLLQTLATDGGSACHNPPPSRRQPRQT